ncbi:hypothetical protein E2K80_08065 [Rhodophyticola sp. CCM32]|uniref:hypothetical protein n=1 Tax=Rhodophyticola sp. CCM32 TaxID=2916397 RepID=UPI00107EF353|nr:hypothetical protein [Rhodophyticola sp. CCM32]QBY00692.1 hypothetical protein E2K80_08065 [Rhodophyticola sp. CCM32]
MRLTVFLICLTLAACGRPLTPAERAFVSGVQGPGLDVDHVRIVENPLIGLSTRSYPVRPRTTCRERIFPEPEGETIEGRVAGVVLFNRLHVREDYAIPDYIRTADGGMHLVAAMFFAHEMTHIWQWQNREITGYHPARAFAEHLRTEDPYLFDGDSTFAFLDYGYEQQASLVEEYVCCRTLDPDGARTGRLERLLQQVMPVTPLQSSSDGVRVYLPWEGVELQGICS